MSCYNVEGNIFDKPLIDQLNNKNLPLLKNFTAINKDYFLRYHLNCMCFYGSMEKFPNIAPQDRPKVLASLFEELDFFLKS